MTPNHPDTPNAPVGPWQELSRTRVFEQFSRRIDKVRFRLPNHLEADFYIKTEGPAAGVLPLTPNNDVILVRQYRPGPQELLDELPGGFLDPNEDPLDTVERELLEETGYQGDLEFIGTWIDDAYSTMVRYGYVARNCRKVAEPTSDGTEQTEVLVVTLGDFRTQLRSGRMTDVELGYLALDHLSLLNP